MPSKNGHTTIVDVARAAGVSISTVSRVLNDRGDVSPRARDAVRAALATTRYTASPIARSLVGARTRLIGLHARRLTDDYTGALIHGILEFTEAAGYGLLILATGPDGATPTGPLIETLPDGLLVLSPLVDEAPEPGPRAGGRPVVLIEQRGTGRDVGVTATHRVGEAEATRHLVALGHRRIGFVAGTPIHSTSRERLDGFRDALAEAGIRFDPGLVAPGWNDRDSGLAAGRRLLALPDRPTAIVASNDLEAVGVLGAAREAGLRVPDDLSVVGFDDLPLARHTHPPLTTVHQPLAAMGRRAAEMLIGWVEGAEPVPSRVVLPTRLVVRESSGPPPAARFDDGREGA